MYLTGETFSSDFFEKSFMVYWFSDCTDQGPFIGSNFRWESVQQPHSPFSPLPLPDKNETEIWQTGVG